MSDEELKLVIEAYQRKSFELFNTNIVLEVQVNTLKKQIALLSEQLEKLQKSKRGNKVEEDFT